jgi:hypothetical protein
MDTKKIVIAAALLALALPVAAKTSYESVLKKWTRSDKVYVLDNFEARMIWNATYLSPDFRAARREKLSEILEWSGEELLRKVKEDGEESAKFDVFFVGIYAGSAKWPEIGKDSGSWRIFLEPGPGPTVEAAEMERVPVTQLDRELYPYLDKWSHAYYVRFPKILRPGQGFKIRMAGIPARSELVWK